jgi:hypothetical protein
MHENKTERFPYMCHEMDVNYLVVDVVINNNVD